MKPILVVYATREGQTQRIAEHILAIIRAHGRAGRLVEVAKDTQGLELAGFDAVFLAASVHMGKHEREMVQFVREQRDALAKLPTVFLSTSMSEAAAEQGSLTAARREQQHAEAERMIQEFFTETGFHASMHKAVAGALRYTQYNWLVRLVMRHISKTEGVSTDISRDHEYTDWIDLDRFVDAILKDQSLADSASFARVRSD